MTMLREFEDVKQFTGEPRRRWFEDEGFDLVVWQNEGGEIIEFELSYDKSKNQRAVRWGKSTGFAHYRVDDGDSPGKHKETPVLFPNGDFDFEKIARLFALASKEVNEKIAKFVHEKILQYANC
jgi:hypothetical protein